MKKTIICLLLLSLAFSLFGCSVWHPYEFRGEKNNIQTIEIINSKGFTYDEVNMVVTKHEYDILCQVEDIQLFLNDFSNITCYLVFSDPRGISEENEEVAIKVTYTDGSYEAIGLNGRMTFRTNEPNVYVNDYDLYDGFHCFDEKEFQSLIDKYLNQHATN